MSVINYGLIVSDFDGTLLPQDGKIPHSVTQAITRYVNAGGVFAVCTGRMLASIMPQVRAMGLKGLVVAYQGTVIADIESGKLLKNGGLDSAQAEEVCKVIEGRGKTINAYADDVLYTTAGKDDRLIKRYERITGIMARHVEGAMSAFVRENNLCCQKVISVVPPHEKQELYEYMRAILGDRYDVTYSAEILVEVSPHGDNKGAALKFLADYYNIPIAMSIAVGDSLNDLPMLQTAGIGVAVANACEELKSGAKEICPSCDDGGVAHIIEKYGFAK